MLKKRLLVWGIVLVAFTALGVWAMRQPPVEVETVQVVRGPLLVTLEQEGRTHVEDRYVVSAPVAGYARRIELHPGDAVSVGEPLAVLEPLAPASLDPRSRAEAQADLTRAEAEERSARADSRAADAAADRARQRHERLSRALTAGAVSRDEVDAAAADLKSTSAAARAAAFRAELARAGVAAARARLSVAGGTRSGESEITVSAPVSACVLRVEHESEGVVQAGEPLLDLGCRSSLEIRADVLSADAVSLRPGLPALIRDWGGGSPLHARVRRIEPGAFTKVSALGVEEQRVWVILDLTDPPADWASLGDAFRVMVSFELWRGQDVLQVPAASVFDHEGHAAVFVLRPDGRLGLRDITTGHRSPAAVEVVSGLTAGEAVVLHPNRDLRAGQRARDAGRTE